ncbi:hypothetical protein EXU57_05735 [Segetibacter sp. 3557_3]|uniref:hypothetical protein n=1 Tax=Segetibacter sp. 3557_3 TaxID=2547429 RepID=UPI00105908AB|nr:hypothetical protein [Segetibacter sp. 3557_3]TDH27965.1 hypothetical protein EXU57_05735 [Segetibacter sp. 3557_3]
MKQLYKSIALLPCLVLTIHTNSTVVCRQKPKQFHKQVQTTEVKEYFDAKTWVISNHFYL